MTERRIQWTLELVVAELQKLHASGVTLTYAGMRAAGHGSVITAAERYAGSWTRAIKLAGVDAPVRLVWTRKMILEKVRALHAEGVDLSSQQLATSGYAGMVAASRRFFDSWPAVRDAAGLPKYRRGPFKTWKDIRDALRALYTAGEVMSTSALTAAGHADLVAAARTFGGGWNVALERAGIPLVMTYHHWTPAEVLDAIRRLHASGDSLSYPAVVASGQRKLVKAAARYFKTWVGACAAAIPSYRPLMTAWDENRVMAEIRERQRKGLSVRSTDVFKDDQALVAAARRLGIPWREACRRAGVPASALAKRPEDKRVRWSVPLILATLREAAKKGLPLTGATFRGGFVGAVHRRFGSWEACMEAAGLSAVYKRDQNAARASRLSHPRPTVRVPSHRRGG